MKKIKPIWLGVIGCFVISALAVGSFLNNEQTSADTLIEDNSTTPTNVIMRYWSLVTHGSVGDAKKLLTNSVNIKGTSEYLTAKGPDEDSWVNIIQIENLKIQKIISEKQKADRAVVVLQVSKANGHFEELQCRMVKIMDEWKIYTIGRNYSPDDPMCKIPGICDFLE
jgi:hypothetical protein